MEKLPGPISVQATSRRARRTSGVRRRPEPRPLLRTIGKGQPQLRSAVVKPASLMRMRQSRRAAGSLPMNWGVRRSGSEEGLRSSRSLRGSKPGLAVMKGVKASVKCAAER